MCVIKVIFLRYIGVCCILVKKNKMDIFKGTTVYDDYQAIDIDSISNQYIPIMLRTNDKEIIPKWLSHQLNNVYPLTTLETGTLTTVIEENLCGKVVVYIYIGVLRRVKNKEVELK